MGKKDYYDILGIRFGASAKAVKTAYRQLALKYHPDHNPHNSMALEKFKKILEAYETLNDSDQRRAYDKNYEPQKNTTASTKKSTAEGPKKNLRYNIFITLEEVVTGCEKTIRYIRKIGNQKETVQLKVQIPKGAYHMQRLKVSQYGDQASQNTGDLFVIIQLQNHIIFKQERFDLYVNVPVNYLQVVTGAIIEIPTLRGIKKIKLRSCDFQNFNFELSGQGLPDLKTGETGKLLIHCFLEHPKRLSPEQKNALQKLLPTWPKGDMMQQYQNHLKTLKGR